jgi:hypothetical protein
MALIYHESSRIHYGAYLTIYTQTNDSLVFQLTDWRSHWVDDEGGGHTRYHDYVVEGTASINNQTTTYIMTVFAALIWDNVPVPPSLSNRMNSLDRN